MNAGTWRGRTLAESRKFTVTTVTIPPLPQLAPGSLIAAMQPCRFPARLPAATQSESFLVRGVLGCTTGTAFCAERKRSHNHLDLGKVNRSWSEGWNPSGVPGGLANQCMPFELGKHGKVELRGFEPP